MFRIHPHALKHGVTEEDIEHALSEDGWVDSMIHPGNPLRIITIGFDCSGALIQVIEADDPDFGRIVINAMRPPQAHVRKYFEQRGRL
jgi:hypothetical protein